MGRPGCSRTRVRELENVACPSRLPPARIQRGVEALLPWPSPRTFYCECGGCIRGVGAAIRDTCH